MFCLSPVDVFFKLDGLAVNFCLAVSGSGCAWAGGTFFPVVLLCQFFGFWQEICFDVTCLGI
jgi:hypothetical protein